MDIELFAAGLADEPEPVPEPQAVRVSASAATDAAAARDFFTGVLSDTG